MTPRHETPEVTLSPPWSGKDLGLAAKLGIAPANSRDDSVWQLVRGIGGLSLHAPRSAGGMALELSLRHGPLAQRLRSARKTDSLPRAFGLPRRTTPPTVVDAMAGLCRDAMVLAKLGCQVTAIERVPALAMLAAAAIDGSELGTRLSVQTGDAETWLAGLSPEQAPEVVYLDPMFAESGKAQVKKDMQVCRALAGPPDDTAPLFALAKQVARERVVVKRHPDLPPLGPGVSFAVEGERVRFDVYLR